MFKFGAITASLQSHKGITCHIVNNEV